jgi:hypothetical protein
VRRRQWAERHTETVAELAHRQRADVFPRIPVDRYRFSIYVACLGLKP